MPILAGIVFFIDPAEQFAKGLPLDSALQLRQGIAKALKQFEAMANIESVKAASDIYAPVSGKVAETNEILSASPDLLNKSCYKDGWICRIEAADTKEKANLMDAAAYEEYVKGLGH